MRKHDDSLVVKTDYSMPYSFEHITHFGSTSGNTFEKNLNNLAIQVSILRIIHSYWKSTNYNISPNAEAKIND